MLTPPPMRLAPIAALALLPALLLLTTGCGSAEDRSAPVNARRRMAAVTAERRRAARAAGARRSTSCSPRRSGETRAVVLMHAGEIAAERYAPGYDADTRFVSWSMAKTVTALLIGLLVSDGLLELDAPAPVPRWQRPGDPRAEITLRNSSSRCVPGLQPYRGGRGALRIVRGADAVPRRARTTWPTTPPRNRLEAEPGERFEYSSNTSVILADIAARALTDSTDPDTRRAAVDRYLRARLFDPLGMDSVVPEYDAAGTLIGGSLIHATARDWARLGEFLRHGGSVRGAQLVPRRWMDRMRASSPASPHYGFHTWLNRPAPELLGDREHQLFPERAPESVFALIGHMGQYVLVSPEQKLTLVRLGHSDGEERRALVSAIADVLALYPAD